ncbi:MAG: hypothetical protein ACE5RT_05280 [Nitrosopumilaceae archaeon]
MFEFSLILFFILSAYAQIPDYDNPYAPIFTDKPVYTWTDKVIITIIAPSWNSEKFGIDSIGDDEGHFIKLSTGQNSLEPYKLTETDLNSGIFVGEVILTGFSHDVDGDGNPDTNPRTVGSGPTNGFLETERDNAITISFEFADGVVLTHSAPISWNIGTIKFLESQYLVDQTAKIKIIDQDMNLNPEAVDQLQVEIASDSDIAGITADALETNNDSGVFEATITFSQNFASSGNRLLAIPGDKLYAKYEDRTLPKPYSISDEKHIVAESLFDSNISPMKRTSIETPIITDSIGKILDTLRVNNQMQIVSKVVNAQDFGQNFVYLVQITNETGKVVSLSWIQGKFDANQSLELSQSWLPTESGEYRVETFVWNSLQNPVPISPSISQTFHVE